MKSWISNTAQTTYTSFRAIRTAQSYYCVNDAGTRRDVTGQAAGNFISNFLPSLGSLVIPIAGGGLLTVGIILAVLGAIFSRRRSVTVATVGGFPVQPSSGFPVQDDLDAVFRQPLPVSSAELTAKLRQIEEAHKSGLISDDEYQRMRQQTLDAMK